jgi:hypothetical protein
MTTFVFLALDSALSKRQLPVLSIPFSITASIFLSFLHRLSNVEWFYPYHWELQGNITTGVELIDLFFKTISSVLFIPNVSVGILIMIALVAYSRIQVFIILASFLTVYFLDSIFLVQNTSTAYHWTNFNLILFGISIGSFFLSPGLASLLLTMFSLIVCFFGFQLFISLWGTRLEWIHSLPYTTCCIATLLITRKYFPWLLNPYLGMPPELSLDLTDSRLARFGQNSIVLRVPFDEASHILQGFDGPWTHQGHWRYALDFNMKDRHGKTYVENPSGPEAFLIYGKKVLSPCYGWVESIEGHQEDRKIGFVDHDRNWGNFVLIRTSNGYYVLLAHLRKNSIQVKVGDYIYAGQQLGEVGNSGYSFEPHLHLHVQTTAHIGSQTLPFKLESYSAPSRNVRFYNSPKAGEIVEPLIENKTLQFALSLKPGQKLVFKKSGSKSNAICSIQIGLDKESGKWWISDNGANRLYFWHDSKHFYFYDLISNDESILTQLMAACPIIPLTYGASVRWRDYLPARIQYVGFWRVLYELKRLFWIPRSRRAAFYRMNSDGMRILGRVFYQNQLTRTKIEFDPFSGIQSIQVGSIRWTRVFKNEATEEPQMKVKECHERNVA